MFKNDRYNEIILQELQANGRMPNAELAEKIGLSPSACLRRVQDLEAAGVIQGYRAVIDAKKLGIRFAAYVCVGLREHSLSSQTQFEEALQDVPEVRECHNVTGGFEYILRIETKDIDTYKHFHSNILGAISQVATIETHVIMESTKWL